MPYISESTLQHLRGDVRLGVFFQLDTDPALHVWMGASDIRMGDPFGVVSVDPRGTRFLGGGRLLNIPDLEMLINGIADRIELQLSGVTPEFLAQLDEEAPPVSGVEAHIGIAPLDERWQPLTPIIPIWTGAADYWRMSSMAPDDPTKPRVNGVVLSMGSGDLTRARASRLTWTDEAQRDISPTDAFCNRVGRYLTGLLIAWPRYS